MNIKPGALITIIIILVIGVAAVIAINVGKKPTTSPATEIKPLAEDKLAEISDDIKGISGKIIAVGKDTITIEALIMMKDSTKPPIKNNVKVMSDANTVITKLTFPSPEEIMSGTEPIEPREETLKINELKIGDTVDIRAKENIYEYIKSGTQFVASEINVVVYEQN